MSAALGTMRVHEVLRMARDRGASDVHLAGGYSVVLRIDGELVAAPTGALDLGELEAFVNECFDEGARASLRAIGLCDAARYDAELGPLRLHAFRERGGVRCSIRLLPLRIPSLESLDLSSSIASLAQRRNGLVLVVGPAGSGKTTLLAAMIDSLNRRDARVILTLEDPIEYVHRSDRAVVAQCEIGADVSDFALGIRGMLRADPDVIVIGELRDPESMRAALSAAETGHLVMASLHTIDAALAIDRIVDSFPADARAAVRSQLAQTLAGIVALRLVRRARAPGRRAAVEILIASDAVRSLIREGKTHQIRSVLQTGRILGMQTLEMHLCELVQRGEITMVTAHGAAERPAEIQVREAAGQ